MKRSHVYSKHRSSRKKVLNKLDPARRALLLQRRRAARPFTGHQLVANSLSDSGITHIYGITGSPVDQTFAACAAKGLTIVGTRHQQGAMFAAMAHNYVAGALKAAVLVSAGPAVTNCTTGISVALENGWPLVIIGGRQTGSMEKPGVFQALDAATLFAPITKARAKIAQTAEIETTIHWACTQAMHTCPGPVYLDLSEEALQGKAPSKGSPTEKHAPLAEPDKSDLQKAIHLLASAQRPALLIGKGLRWTSAEEALDHLTRKLGIPFAASPMGRGYLPDSHALNFTNVRAAMLSKADVVVLVGARLDWTFRFGSEIPADSSIISINIDPEEASKTAHRGVSLGVDARIGLEGILEGLRALNGNEEKINYDSTHLKELEIARQKESTQIQAQCEQKYTPPSPYQWLARLGKLLPTNAITILDHGTVSLKATQSMLAAETPVSRITPGSNGCVGGGIPYAIGAKIANPDRPVVAVCGDFSAGLSLMELETLARRRVPAIIIVINNDGIDGAVRQKVFFGQNHPELVCQFQNGIRYDHIMKSLGGTGIRVTCAEQIDDAFQQALDSGSPVLIDVVTDPEFSARPSDPSI